MNLTCVSDSRRDRMCGHWGVMIRRTCALADEEGSSQNLRSFSTLTAVLHWANNTSLSCTFSCLAQINLNETRREILIHSLIISEHTVAASQCDDAIRLHYGIWPLLWRMEKPCVGLWLCVCVCVCAHPHYLLLPAPGDSAPSLHLSSWLATICLSTSSSLVSRSNWSSCT